MTVPSAPMRSQASRLLLDARLPGSASWRRARGSGRMRSGRRDRTRAGGSQRHRGPRGGSRRAAMSPRSESRRRGAACLRPRSRGAGKLLPYVAVDVASATRPRAAADGIALPRRPLHRAQDPIVRAAAAEMTVERLADLGIGRIGVLRQQRRRRHDHPARAVAALERLLGDERGLHRMRLARACRDRRRW